MSSVVSSAIVPQPDDDARKLYALWQTSSKPHRLNNRWRRKQFSLVGRLAIKQLMFLCLKRGQTLKLVAQCELMNEENIQQTDSLRTVSTAKEEGYRLLSGVK